MRVLWISIVTILADQAAKVLIVRHMYPSQSISLLGNWLKLTYLENPGMAFGIAFGPPAMISIFSIAATLLILLYLSKIKTGYLPYRASIGLVLGGAFGNIIDRVFYGSIYYDNPLFEGRVVDFIHVDAWRGLVPDWIPLMGGKVLALFPIWNIADMAIVLGVIGILFFQKTFHKIIVSDADSSSPESLDALGVASATVNPSHIDTEVAAQISAPRKLVPEPENMPNTGENLTPGDGLE